MPESVIDFIDDQMDDYEVLSVRSYDTELGEDQFAEQARLALSDSNDGSENESKYNVNEDETEEGSEANSEADSEADAQLNESIDEEAVTASLLDGSTSDSYKLPSDFPWSEHRARVMCELQDGLAKELGGGQVWETVEDTESACKTSSTGETESAADAKSWRAVILPQPSNSHAVKYFVFSGRFQKGYFDFISKIHRQFPHVNLIWVDNKTLKTTSRWVTHQQLPLLREDLVRHGVRFDIYAQSSDHTSQSELLIDKKCIRGFAKLPVVPICIPGSSANLSDIPCSINAPVEIDSFCVPHPLTFDSNWEDINERHLAAVLGGRKRVPVRNIVSARSSREGSYWSKLEDSPMRIVLILISILLITSSVTVWKPTAFRTPAACSSDSANACTWISQLFASHSQGEMLEIPVASSTPSSYATVFSQQGGLLLDKTTTASKELSRSLSERVGEIPHLLPSLTDIEAFFREISIQMYKAMNTAEQVSFDAAKWAKEQAINVYNSANSGRTKLEAVGLDAIKYMRERALEAYESNDFRARMAEAEESARKFISEKWPQRWR